ncbi:MAG: hypothetical protein ACREBB_10485 [Nitrosotalea sp.]
MSWYDNSHTPNVHELEYLNKVNWLWSNLSVLQRSEIESSITNDTLRQENSKHCVIGEAMGVNRINAIPDRKLFLDRVLGLVKMIFYDGPSYDNLLERNITKEEKKMLNDIYYAKIGDAEYQYRRANELIRSHIVNRLTVI